MASSIARELMIVPQLLGIQEISWSLAAIAATGLIAEECFKNLKSSFLIKGMQVCSRTAQFLIFVEPFSRGLFTRSHAPPRVLLGIRLVTSAFYSLMVIPSDIPCLKKNFTICKCVDAISFSSNTIVKIFNSISIGYAADRALKWTPDSGGVMVLTTAALLALSAKNVWHDWKNLKSKYDQ